MDIYIYMDIYVYIYMQADNISPPVLHRSYERHTIYLPISSAEYRLFYRALLQKRTIIESILLTEDFHVLEVTAAARRKSIHLGTGSYECHSLYTPTIMWRAPHDKRPYIYVLEVTAATRCKSIHLGTGSYECHSLYIPTIIFRKLRVPLDIHPCI